MFYKVTKGESCDFIYLSDLLDGFLNELAGGQENREEYIPHNKTSDITYSVVAYDGDIPVGCAGLKHFDEKSIEIKRVYVKKQYQRQGIAKKLIFMMEQKAKQLEYKRLILETGRQLTSANYLYKNMGYKTIDNYGPYVGMDNSICYEKKL